MYNNSRRDDSNVDKSFNYFRELSDNKYSEIKIIHIKRYKIYLTNLNNFNILIIYKVINNFHSSNFKNNV